MGIVWFSMVSFFLKKALTKTLRQAISLHPHTLWPLHCDYACATRAIRVTLRGYDYEESMSPVTALIDFLIIEDDCFQSAPSSVNVNTINSYKYLTVLSFVSLKLKFHIQFRILHLWFRNQITILWILKSVCQFS